MRVCPRSCQTPSGQQHSDRVTQEKKFFETKWIGWAQMDERIRWLSIKIFCFRHFIFTEQLVTLLLLYGCSGTYFPFYEGPVRFANWDDDDKRGIKRNIKGLNQPATTPSSGLSTTFPMSTS